MRRVILTVAVLVIATVVFLLVTLPPKPLEVPLDGVDQDLLRRTLRGAYHVHTTRSDGAHDRDAVAAAAARAGLQFVIFTEHGDGTRPPAPPAYVDGVLCLDGVEISTNGGHYVAIDLPPAPYPLAGEAAAVVEDVARFGGFGFAAHPDHPRPDLAWSDWTAPVDGLEWVNLDSAWRDESIVALARIPFDYVLRPSGAIGSILDRPVPTLDRWDALERTRPVVGMAAVDAHGSGRRDGEGRAAKIGLGPGYEESFRTISNRVLLDRPPSGDAASDARLLLDAIRGGRVYTVIDAIANNAVLRIRPGDGAFELASPLPSGARPELIRAGDRSRLEIPFDGAPGTPPVPWVVSNWSGPRAIAPVPRLPQPLIAQPFRRSSPWRVEKDPASSGQVSVAEEAATLHYVLAEGRTSQYVAAAADLAPSQPYSTLILDARAVKPMRVSVQLRFPDGERWVKSVYLDTQDREVAVRVGEMAAAGAPSSMPNVTTAESILLVVDLVNSRPGDSGSFTVRNLRRVR
jgi:hypothetical protein